MAKGNGKAKSLEQQIVDRLDQLVAKMEHGFENLNASLINVNTQLDRVVENTGAHWRDLERRVAALEDKSPAR